MFRKLHPKAGSRPGTLMIPDDALATRVRIVTYDADDVQSRWVEDEESLRDALNTDQNIWVHFEGLRDVELLLLVAEHFDVHPLTLEDVVNVPQRPKEEVTDNYVVAVTRVVREAPTESPLTEQASLILGERFVLSVQETYCPRFQPIVDRLHRPSARLRRYGSDYLAYALLDTIVDSYFPLLESLGERLDSLESRVLTHPRPEHLQQITRVKRQLVSLRRTTWAQREMVAELLREDSSLATDQVKTFTRDIFDHCAQIADVVDMYRETATGLANTYMSSIGQRTNEIMKTLTIVGSIFIPLTFLAGIYGMNFEHMPELSSRWAYPTIWFLMAAIAIGMVTYFYRCGWIGSRFVPTEQESLVGEVSSRAAAVQADDWDQRPGTKTREVSRAA